MKTMQESSVSTFAKMVDKLRNKSEEELKMLYTKFFSNELIDEWKNITHNADFNGSNDDEIIKAVQKNRFKKQNE
ncbi:MAG: hypothetical protein ABI359_13660 [Ginsengibacter sp.]